MPQIPVYTQRTTPQGTVAVPRSPDLTRDVFIAGASIERATDAWARKLDADAAAWAGASEAKAGAYWSEELLKRQQNVQPGAPDFTGSVLKDWGDYRKEQEGRAPNDAARAYMAQRFDSIENNLRLKSMDFEAREGVRHRVTLNDQAIDDDQIAVRANPESFAEKFASRRAVIAESGLPPAEADRLLEKARAELSTAAVRSIIDDDPRKALEALRAEPGKSGNIAIEALPAARREAAISSAEVEIRRLEAEERARQAEARAAAAARASFLKDYMADAQQAYAMGFGLPEGYGEARAAIAALPDDDPNKARLVRQDAVLSTLEKSGFLSLSPDQQQQAKTALEAQMQAQGANPATIDMLSMAGKIAAETTNRAKADPFAFALQRGVVKPPESTGDAKADLAARAEAARVASAYFGKPVPGFTKAELSNLADSYQKADVTDRLAILGSITDTHGQAAASTVFAALDKQNQSGMALAGALAMDDTEAARLVIRGQKVLQEGGKANLTPKATDLQPPLFDLLGDAYGIGTSSRKTVEEGVVAAYAALSAEAGDQSGELDSKRLKAAVEAVTGGLVEYAGKKMPAPLRGVTQRQFTAWADSLEEKDFAGVAGIPASTALRLFRDDGWLEAIGPNRYVPTILGPDGQPRFMADPSGDPLSLEFDPSVEPPSFLDDFMQGYGGMR